MSEEIANLIKSAIAALSQNATFPPDVEFAKNRLREAQSLLTQHALDGFAGLEMSGKCSACGNEISISVSTPSRQ